MWRGMNKLLALGLLVSSMAHAQAVPDLTDVIRKPGGNHVITMTQFEARDYCLAQGQRLPTVREFALYSQSLGAQGISETAQEGYDLVRGSDPDGNPDYFYFNSTGYESPGGVLGYFWFWSSSVNPGDPRLAYGLDGDSGATTNDYRNNDNYRAVRCIRRP